MPLIKNKYQVFLKNVGMIIEICIVLSLAFGLFIYSSTKAFLNNSKSITAQSYNSYDFIFIVIYSLIILTIVSYYLKYRGLRYTDFNLNFKISMIGVAILLVLIRETIGRCLTFLLTAFSFKIDEPSITLDINVISIILIIVVNSVFEEFFLIGYIFKRFEKINSFVIIFISFIIRASFHTYQGLAYLPMVFIMALLFGLYYIKYKQLWPLIIAHAIGNIFHFLNYYYQWV